MSELLFNIRSQAIGGGAAQVLLNLLEQIYAGEELTTDRALLRQTARDYVEALQEGYSGHLTDIDWNSPDFDTLQHLTENVYQFAAAKNYHELKDLSEAVRDGDHVRSFSEFQEEARRIVGKYNGAWLRTEYNQAVSAAQSGARWNEFARNKQTMPYLQYQCVMDENTRADHAALNGIIKRIDDPFWDRYMPPNGWGCRCEAVQLPGSSYEETKDENIHPPFVSSMFQINFGKQGIAFPEGHAYFRRLPKDFARQAKDMAREEVRRVIANAEEYNRLKDDPDYIEVRFDNYSGGMMAVHNSHQLHQGENEERYFAERLSSGELEIKCGRQLMQAGHKVVFVDETRQYVTDDGTIGTLPTLDILLDGKPMDIRNVTKDSTLHQHLSYKNKQLGNVMRKTGVVSDSLVLYFYKPEYFTDDKMREGIERFKNLKKDGKPIEIRIEHVFVVRNGHDVILKYDI